MEPALPTANASTACAPLHGATCAACWSTLDALIGLGALIDVGHIVLFLQLGVPQLAWPNLSSLLLYATAHVLLRAQLRAPCLALLVVDVALHATAGTIMLGAESGFHHYVLLFVPIAVVSSRGWRRNALLVLLFACYVALDLSAYFIEPTKPLPDVILALVRWVNVAVLFCVFAFAASMGRQRLGRAEERIRFSATRDPLTGLHNAEQFIVLAEHALARQARHDSELALALVDVDAAHDEPERDRMAPQRHVVNLGHGLRRYSRPGDVVARWGERRFALMLSDAGPEEASAAVQRLRDAALADLQAAASPSPLITVVVTGLHSREGLRAAVDRAEDLLKLQREGAVPASVSEPARAHAPRRAGRWLRPQPSSAR